MVVRSSPQRGLITFFLLAFGIPWVGWITFDRREKPSDGFENLTMFWLPAACSVAGFCAALVEGGVAGFRNFSRRVFGVRIPWFIWVLAFLLPFAAGALTFINHPSELLHGGSPSLRRWSAAMVLQNFWTGPIGEEFGWRGYLFNRLRSRLTPIAAAWLIGPIWAFWHVPLFYDGPFAHVDSAMQFVATTTAWSVTFCFIVERARGSVLPSILAHWTLNSQMFIFAALFPVVAREHLPGGVPFCIASLLIAIGVTLIWWRSPDSRAPAIS